MNEEQRIADIIYEIEVERELNDVQDSFTAGFDSGLALAVRIIKSYYPTKEEQNDNV
jgi:hypothetical protein